MGKRSDYDKVPRDKYYTIDRNAVPDSFLEYISGHTYAEPCYGGGDLEGLIGDMAGCKWRSDLDPDPDVPVLRKDATTLTRKDLSECDLIVTNPPFTWELLQPLLDHLPTLTQTWLLLPANIMHNKRMAPYMEKCNWVVSVGRLYWFTSDYVIDYNIGRVEKPKFGLSEQDLGTGEWWYTGWYDFTNKKPTKSQYTRGVDDYAWFCWDYNNVHESTKFIGRQ